MKSCNTTYLYQYKNSSNYFFRLRLSFLEKFGYHGTNEYFVASLRTADFDDARWLALYIKRNLLKDIDMECIQSCSSDEIGLNTLNNDNVAKVSVCYRMGDGEGNTAILPAIEPDDVYQSAYFKRLLKAKFVELLKVGKSQIEFGLGSELIVNKPFSETEHAMLGEKIHVISNEHERGSLVRQVTKAKHSKDFSEERLNGRYIESLNMLNALVKQLNDKQRKFEAFEDKREEVNPVSSIHSHLELLNVLKSHKNVQEKLQKETSKNQSMDTKFYALKAQFEKFKLEKSTEIHAKTIQKYQSSFDLLYTVIPPEFDLRIFSKVQTQEVKQMLLNRYQNESKGCLDKALSVKTKNGILSNFRTFFDWFIDNVFDEIKNPFSGVSFAKGKSKPLKRRSFTDEEVRKQLAYKPKAPREARHFRNDANWFLPISLYTGMRLNEISALPLSHVKKIDDVWCFDLHGLDVKNEASERTVPIAEYLLERGLIEYVESLKLAGETLLFPEIRRGKTQPGSAGWGDPISRWFNRTVIKNIGIDSDQEEKNSRSVVFHCNRRTMISACVNGVAQHHLIKRIVGHSQEDDITLSVYSDVDDIPLSHLKDLLDKHLNWHVES